MCDPYEKKRKARRRRNSNGISENGDQKEIRST